MDGLLPKNFMRKAILYSLSRWDKLTAYTKNGQLRIDNNLVENSIRPVSLGEKNYMFLGSQASAKNAAIFYSLVESCRMQGINPQKYLENVLSVISDISIKKLTHLLPGAAEF